MSTNAHHQDNNAAAKQHSAPTSKGATPPHAPAHIGEKAAFGGGMAEGVSFSILLMNLVVPYIEVLTRQDKLGIAKVKKSKKEGAGK